MRKLRANNHADMNMIISAIIMAITLAIGLVVVYSVFGGVDLSTPDNQIKINIYAANNGPDASDDANTSWTVYNNSGPAANATEDLMTNVATYFTIGPIAIIVIAAVGILSYVLLLRRT